MNVKRGVWRRLTLDYPDGSRRYLSRRGITTRWFTIYLHRMTAPDPGTVLHNHPWTFITIPLWGGYVELRATTRNMMMRSETRRPFRPRRLTTGEAHQIVALRRRSAWSLVIAGPVRQQWGFFTRDGFVEADRYKAELRGLVA